ncbi:hypothetical protein UlMin_019723 [Ulmus minor]
MTNTSIILLLILSSHLIYHPLISCQFLFPSPIFFGSRGKWQMLQESVGISPMHMQLLRNNMIIMFDRTDFGRSNLSLPGGRCRFDPSDTVVKIDCTAHSILYDIASNTFRPLMVQTDTWCSSGSVLPNGTLIQTGGYNDGDHTVRTFTPCVDNYCDWVEIPNSLAERRWYATNQILPDGRIIIIGGRKQYNYEFFPQNPGNPPLFSHYPNTFFLDFLRQTTDFDENNLYPFVHLLPDGNLFIFANTRSILFNYNQNLILKEFPPIPGGDPRNYPSSGSSVLLPLDENKATTEVEIMICGGAPRYAHGPAMQGMFIRALNTCGRLMVTQQNPNWIMENMPIPRVMGDMVILPSGEVIIINGATLGTAGWEAAHNPVMNPLIYSPSAQPNERFTIMEPSARARLYHSTAILVPDGRVFVGGSNPHVFYNFSDVEYPTDLTLEAFSPPYLSAEYQKFRPKIQTIDEIVRYQQSFSVIFTIEEYTTLDALSVRIIAPSFSTHSFSMNQRMVALKLMSVSSAESSYYNATVVGPATSAIAPPGYYMLFVVHAGIPSYGMWVKLE